MTWWNDFVDKAIRAKKQVWKNNGSRDLYQIATKRLKKTRTLSQGRSRKKEVCKCSVVQGTNTWGVLDCKTVCQKKIMMLYERNVFALKTHLS